MSIMTVPLMKSSVEGDAPDPQKKVLAILAAYNAVRGPMPWSMLLFAVERLQQAHDEELSFGKDFDGEVERALYQVVQNLQLLNLVRSGPRGTAFTNPGEETLRAWNGTFAARKALATDALARMGLLPRGV